MRRLRWGVRRELVGELVTRLEGGRDLQEVLQVTLGDPTLRVGYPLDDGTRFVTADGGQIELPGEDDPTARATPLEHDGRLVAVVVHDPSLARNARLLAGVAGASALAAAHAQLAAELEASLAEVRASRARVVAAGDAARRRVERDLHDGAQQRLIAAKIDARLALAQARDPALRGALERACEQLDIALAELRELARGLYPVSLSEQGLATALAALAERAPERVELVVSPGIVCAAEVEESAYFCVATAIVAAGGPTRVAIEQVAGDLRIEVSGVALGEGDAQQLLDRVEAVGGSLKVVAADGFTAVLPARR